MLPAVVILSHLACRVWCVEALSINGNLERYVELFLKNWLFIEVFFKTLNVWYQKWGVLNISLLWLIMDSEHNILWYIELKVWWRWIGNDLYVWCERVCCSLFVQGVKEGCQLYRWLSKKPMFWRHAVLPSSTHTMIWAEQVSEPLARLIAWEYFRELMLMCGLQYRVYFLSADSRCSHCLLSAVSWIWNIRSKNVCIDLQICVFYYLWLNFCR